MRFADLLADWWYYRRLRKQREKREKAPQQEHGKCCRCVVNFDG